MEPTTERARDDHFRRPENESIVSPGVLEHFAIEANLWHESPREIRRGLAWGREKARRLRWVKSQIRLRLSSTEQRCIALYYLRGFTYREIASTTRLNVSSVHRAVQRGIRKLREASERSRTHRPFEKRGRRR